MNMPTILHLLCMVSFATLFAGTNPDTRQSFVPEFGRPVTGAAQFTRAKPLIALPTPVTALPRRSKSVDAAIPLSVAMKVLVVSGSGEEASYIAIITFLQQIGVPYQSVVLSSIPPDTDGNRLTTVALSDPATGRGLYQGIILADSTFGVCDPSCHSLLSAADWATLDLYASRFNVREVSYFTWPEAKWGLLPADAGASYSNTNPLNISLTPAGGDVFSYLAQTPADPIPVNGAAGVWAYCATPTAQDDERTTPLLVAGRCTLAVTHTTSDGRETMSLTMDNAPTLLHSVVFSYGVINWVTRGVFLGSRQIYFTPQVDDMLLGDRLYAPTRPECPQDPACPAVRATDGDLRALLNWQATEALDPQFRDLRLTFLYNGIGATSGFAPWADTLPGTLTALAPRFNWVSHTWSHTNLDCYTVIDGACSPATLVESLAEIDRNAAMANSLGLPIDTTAIVTPAEGGLADPAFLEAAAQRGIRYVLSSKKPATPNTGIVNATNASILEIPFRATRLADDVASPLTGGYGSLPDQYNSRYGPTGPHPLFDQVQTYTQIIAAESDTVLAGLLAYEPYPLVFHTSNIAVYDGLHSLFTDLIGATFAKYRRLYNLPVRSQDMQEIGSLLADRLSYNNSGVTGVYTPGVGVSLTTTSAATIPVTGACSQSLCPNYGGQIQDRVSMPANSTLTLSLAANRGVSLSSILLPAGTIIGGRASTGTVSLNGPAPAGGISVALSSNNSAAAVPATVSIAEGKMSGSFPVTTRVVAGPVPVSITAAYDGVTKMSVVGIAPAPVFE